MEKLTISDIKYIINECLIRLDEERYQFKDGLYHKDVYLPTGMVSVARKILNRIQRNNEYRFPLHIWNHIHFGDKNHKYTEKELTDTLYWYEADKDVPFEYEVRNGKITKIAYRTKLDADYDICVVVTSSGWLKTAWINRKENTHANLDTSKYVHKPEESDDKDNKKDVEDKKSMD